MRSLTPNFRKTTFFVLLLGPNHTQPAKAGFVDICTPFPRPRQGGPPEKKYQMGSGLNQRDRGACGFVRFQTNRKPGKKIGVRGFLLSVAAGGRVVVVVRRRSALALR